MTRRIAPLNALRAFEAAARHLSFTKAAEELHVTPAAISHQIKALEEYCGAPLFRRMTRALLLTDRGQAVLPTLREGFDMLAVASQQMVRPWEDHVLTVSAAPSIAAKWLVTRLERFRTREPEIDVRLDTTDRLTDFDRDGVDMVIRYGGGNYPGVHVEPLFPTAVFPVCSPGLLNGPRPLKEPSDLANHTLLHVDWSSQHVTWPVWRMWLLAAGVEGVDAERGPRFNDAGLILQTAIAGQGVALSADVLAADDLAAGRLVRPFELSVPVDFGYYIVCPEAKAKDRKVSAFTAWLHEEAALMAGEPVSP
jgi:LysR family glycine cleavage system transcriptional activator